MKTIGDLFGSIPFKGECSRCNRQFLSNSDRVEIIADLMVCEPCTNTCRPMLGQDAAEAQRLAFGGRRIDLLKESREFDSSRLEANGLFPPKQRWMFGE